MILCGKRVSCFQDFLERQCCLATSLFQNQYTIDSRRKSRGGRLQRKCLEKDSVSQKLFDFQLLWNSCSTIDALNFSTILSHTSHTRFVFNSIHFRFNVRHQWHRPRVPFNQQHFQYFCRILFLSNVHHRHSNAHSTSQLTVWSDVVGSMAVGSEVASS